MKYALLARVEAKPGKEDVLEQFLKSALTVAGEENNNGSRYAMKIGPSTFGIFDTFYDAESREIHLKDKIAAALMDQAEELLATPFVIEKIKMFM